jgi:fibronectin type 3 domain-containing protein
MGARVSSRFTLAPLFALLLFVLLGATQTASAAIAFVQSKNNSPNNASLTTLSATFANAQTAGNFNVVAIAWGPNSVSISSLTDTKGNTYTLAVGPTTSTAGGTSVIYYAKNIAAGTNTVTVTFNGATGFPDIRIAEYGGISTTAPLDVTAAATGSGTTSDSGSATTTNANDLLVGANCVSTGTTAAGTGYSQREISGWDGNILEDRIVTAVGSYNATAPISPSGNWIMQMAAFKAAGAADTTPPTAPTGLTATATSSSQVNLSWTASTDNVGVTGYRVERCQGASCSTFAQIATPTATIYSDSGLTASTSYSYRVRGTDAAGNLSGYSNTASATTSSAVASIAYVQSANASPNNSALATLSSTFTAAQTAGNFNVVAVGWGTGSATVGSVTDTKGNVYTLAVGPTVTSFGNASIYYAKNIVAAAANGNAVKVTFSAAVPFPDVRIGEYRGISTTNPLDVTAVATGSGTTSDSGSVTTASANDLLIGSNWVTTGTSGAGTGYTQRQISGWDGDILEDRIVSSVGSYNATAPLSPTGNWIMQVAAFRAGGGSTPPLAPTGLAPAASSDTQINLSWTPPSTNTTGIPIQKYLIERCPGTTCTFAPIGATATAAPAYLDTAVTASTTYSYRVRAQDINGTPGAYSGTISASTGTAAAYSCPTAGTATVCYFYDEAGRLKVVRHDDGAQQSYVLDPAGNRLSSAGVPVTPVSFPTSSGATFGLTVTPASATSINLAWSQATGGNGNINYVVTRNGQALTPVTVLSTVDTPLTQGTLYNYTVTATDSDGNSSGPSAVVSGTTFPGAPGVPTFSAVTATSATVTWTAPTGLVTSYAYSINGGSTWTGVGSALSASLTGLSAGNPYVVQVRANNAGGTGAASSATLNIPAPVPGTPGAPTFSAITSSSVTASWTAASGIVISYAYSIDGGITWVNVGNVLSAPITGLASGTPYTVQVRASNGGGAGGASSASVTTLIAVPGAPGAPTFSAITSTSVTASWTVASGTVSSYAYTLNGGSTWVSVGNVLSTSITGLTAGTTYTVQVRAINAAGAGPAASSAPFTPPTPSDTFPWVNGSTLSFCGGQFPITNANYSFSVSAASEAVTVSPSNSIYTVTTSGWASGATLAPGTYSLNVHATFAPDGNSPITITFGGTGHASTATVHSYDKATCP